MRAVDLRSDTVTLPTEEMLDAMRNAPLGDDVFGEDPTVNRLEEIAAKKMGKEAALLTTSGTQANLVSLMAQTSRGDEVILEEGSHIFVNEVGSLSAVGNLFPHTVKGNMGIMSRESVEAALRPSNIHYPPTRVICIENTHNIAGGTIWPPDEIKEIHELAKAHSLKLYMDGARIFNAAVAMSLDVREFTQHVDTLMFCLSKGLSAPVGSVVVGDREFITRARKYRKMLGGGMRQAGVLAAAGIVAIEKMVDRLKDDHAMAQLLARGIAKIPGISIDLSTVRTNIVRYNVQGLGADSTKWVQELKTYGVKASGYQFGQIRMVTHRGIEKEDIEYARGIVERVANEIRK